jgi:phosphonate transport system permease protein
MHSTKLHTPKRLQRPPFWVQFALLVLMLFLGHSLASFEYSGSLQDILKSVQRIGAQMFPPSLERLGPVSHALILTFEMAWIGSVIGLPLSLIAAVLAAKNTSPHPLVYNLMRALVTFLRTTPPLVWAVFLISAVGLGPRAGVVTIALSTIGFCGRFFAEAIEEVHPEPGEALLSLGASKCGIICCAILPAALPSFINTTLFNLEHSTRSSTVLGIVGAGGIGIELMVSIQTSYYSEAATIMILVFAMVMLVEQGCAYLRRLLI